MIFRKEPFFYGHDNYDQLVKIAKVSIQPLYKLARDVHVRPCIQQMWLMYRYQSISCPAMSVVLV